MLEGGSAYRGFRAFLGKDNGLSAVVQDLRKVKGACPLPGKTILYHASLPCCRPLRERKVVTGGSIGVFLEFYKRRLFCGISKGVVAVYQRQVEPMT